MTPNETDRIPYDGKKYRSGIEAIRNAAHQVRETSLTREQQDAVLELIAQAVEGAIQATEAVYNPPTTPEEIERVRKAGTIGSETDLVTDINALRHWPEMLRRGL